MKSQPGTNRPPWNLEETDPSLASELKEKLKEVVDPELDYNVIELGLIRNVVRNEEGIEIEMILTTPFCPYGPEIIQMVWKKSEEVTSLPINVILGMEVWDFSMAEEGLLDDWGLY